MILPDLSPLDYAALAWFLACWAGYTVFADRSRWRERSMTAAMSAYRHRWMATMLQRENRVVDTTIIGNLLHGAAFFASTTIFAIGGLLASLGATDRAISILRDLPFAVETTRTLFELKLILLLTILVFAFFKFAWAFRLFNYCSVLIGSAPILAEDDPQAAHLADSTAQINSLAARHFNKGIRGYFFAMAALGWLIHPLLFMVTATWVVAVLYRRDFRSRSLGFVKQKE